MIDWLNNKYCPPTAKLHRSLRLHQKLFHSAKHFWYTISWWSRNPVNMREFRLHIQSHKKSWEWQWHRIFNALSYWAHTCQLWSACCDVYSATSVTLHSWPALIFTTRNSSACMDTQHSLRIQSIDEMIQVAWIICKPNSIVHWKLKHYIDLWTNPEQQWLW